jgi:hypothetical protein
MNQAQMTLLEKAYLDLELKSIDEKQYIPV